MTAQNLLVLLRYLRWPCEGKLRDALPAEQAAAAPAGQEPLDFRSHGGQR
jgi:hypothetical protein